MFDLKISYPKESNWILPIQNDYIVRDRKKEGKHNIKFYLMWTLNRKIIIRL